MVKLSVSGIKGANNAQLVITIKAIKYSELKKFNENNIIVEINDKYSIGIFLLPNLSPRPAKKGLANNLVKTEAAKMIAIYLSVKPFEDSHNGKNGALIPMTINIEK